MSVEAVKWALEQNNLTLAEKMTLVVIAEAAKDHKGTNIYTSWLAAQTIADRGSMNKRTIFRTITKLVAAKKLALTGRHNMTTIYTLLGDIGCNKYPATGGVESPPSGRESLVTSGVQSPPSGRVSPPSGRVSPQEVAQSHPNHNKPLINPASPEANLVRPAFTRHQSTETRAEQDSAYRQQMRDLGWDPNTMAPIANTGVN